MDRYEEALSRARKLYNESEDERIRKELIKVYDDIRVRYGGNTEWQEGITYDMILAWFEKQGEMMKALQISNSRIAELEQGEQKIADKVEPKFHEGEWCIDNEDGIIFQIVKVLDSTYIYKTNGGREYSCTHYSLENYARLWTIQDAKDGDVLVYGDNPDNHHVEVIMIFKSLRNEKSAFTYFHIFDDSFRIDDWCDCGGDVHPATEEQRALLFQKMKEAGYEWDAEKKEVGEIEQKPAIKLELDENGEPVLTPFEAELFSMVSEAWQGYALGEEVNIAKIVKEHSIELLERANEQKSAWSEDDEITRNALINLVEMYYGGCIDKSEKNRLLSWLKSLRPQNNWKPSELQLECLCDAIRHYNNLGHDAPILKELLEDLKKLTE